MEQSPQDTGSDLPGDRLEEPSLFGREGAPAPAPDEERPEGVGLDDERDACECGEPEFPEEAGGRGVRIRIAFDVEGLADGKCPGAELAHKALRPLQAPVRHVPLVSGRRHSLSGAGVIDGAAVIAEEVEHLVERCLHELAGRSGRCGRAGDPVEQRETPVACLQLLLRLLPVGDVPHNDLDRGSSRVKHPRAPPLDGGHRSVEPDNQQFGERRLLALQVPRDKRPDGLSEVGMDDIKEGHPDHLLRS